MLTAHHISKHFNLNPILQDISFSVNAGERVALIGPNGAGKSTLFRILLGEERPDKGHVTFTPPTLRIGYLAQGFELPSEATLAEVVGQAVGDPKLLEDELTGLAVALGQQPDQPHLQQAYDRLLERLSQYEPGRATAVLTSLGLTDIPQERPIRHLSGGQKTRLALALVLLDDPQLLLLDEPTNHLDIEMLEWLENWLLDFVGGLLFISHDRAFLNRVATHILDLDPETQTLQTYVGDYDDYLAQHQQEKEKQWAAYREQAYEIRRMRQDIARTKEQARRVEITTKPNQPTVRRYAKKVAAKAKAREKKLERYLDSDERVEKPKQGWQLKLDFSETFHAGQDVLHMEQLAVGYAGHPSLLQGLNGYIQAGQRVILTGPNGSGKTTLLKTIAGQVPAQGGDFRLGHSVQLGYMSQEQRLLDSTSTALATIQAVAPLNQTEARSFLHYFLFSGDDPIRPIERLSYGERARLALARLVAQGCNFLLLDEPVNHLDIPSRERFEQALHTFSGTLLAVVHDRYFIGRLATEIWWVEDGGVRRELAD